MNVGYLIEIISNPHIKDLYKKARAFQKFCVFRKFGLYIKWVKYSLN